MGQDSGDVYWTSVVARCLAYLCLKNSDFRDKSLLEQSEFLERMGLPLEDRASVIGSTPKSMRELARQARNKGGKHHAKKRAK
jgi:hypothetical protein